MCVCIQQPLEKNEAMNWEGIRGRLYVEGGKGRDECYNYNIVSQNKIKNLNLQVPNLCDPLSPYSSLPVWTCNMSFTKVTKVSLPDSSTEI